MDDDVDLGWSRFNHNLMANLDNFPRKMNMEILKHYPFWPRKTKYTESWSNSKTFILLVLQVSFFGGCIVDAEIHKKLITDPPNKKKQHLRQQEVSFECCCILESQGTKVSDASLFVSYFLGMNSQRKRSTLGWRSFWGWRGFFLTTWIYNILYKDGIGPFLLRKVVSSSNLTCKKKAYNKFMICSWCWRACPRMGESEIPSVMQQVWRTLCWELTNTIIYLKSICRYHLTSLAISNKQPGKWVFPHWEHVWI